MRGLGDGVPGRIGGYRLLGRLGAGGMGDVYLARSDRGRTVAVKLVRAELAAQEEFRTRFRHEVRAARRVGGFWTAPVLDADTEAVVPWVATGYVAGPSLRQVVGEDFGPLPERSVRTLAAGLALALRDIHRAGLVHRDLKPSNVLVTIDGPRVIDFGIARALETVTDGRLTRTGALVGSPGFMAPEQVRGDRITPACDIFSLGSLLVYAATGKMPFGTAETGFHVVMYRIAHEKPDLEGVSTALVDLIADCLQKDPGARPGVDEVLRRAGARDAVTRGSATAPWLPGPLIARLGRHAVGLLDTEDPVSLTPSSPGRAPAPPSRVPAMPVLAPARKPDLGNPGRRVMLIGTLFTALIVGSVIFTQIKHDADSVSGGDTSTAAPSPADSKSTGGVISERFVGTWTTSVIIDGEKNSRRMFISQGSLGDPVFYLITRGPREDGSGSYHCEFVADLTAASSADGKMMAIFGPTRYLGEGQDPDCPAGRASTLTLLTDDTLVREVHDNGGRLEWHLEKPGI
ncbi:serine/threonine-protein kinase [Streptomyces sp. NPDC049916]|uniref:serine/threonine-protein kinase n=1 Tax=Streptomyces sp. NPDC049916 TaxID=3155156 RepID=UPI00344239C8